MKYKTLHRPMYITVILVLALVFVWECDAFSSNRGSVSGSQELLDNNIRAENRSYLRDLIRGAFRRKRGSDSGSKESPNNSNNNNTRSEGSIGVRDQIQSNLDSKLIEYNISPRETDGSINDWLESHYVVTNKSIPSNDKLFVFLSGSGGKPKGQREITREAAKLGYHAINLRYPNSWMVAQFCKRSNDENCYEKVRSEIIDGKNRSDMIDVNPTNSIENRLIRLILYLDKQHPDQGWSQYVKDGTKPTWESIVIAGHSQGGGHAAMIAKKYRVARVIMFGAPGDFRKKFRSQAPWLGTLGATPAEKYYGFVHSRDRGIKRILESWELLGMADYGSLVNVDKEKSPYNRSHRLTTEETPNRQGKYHGCVVTDSTIPRLMNGTPLFHSVWRYLLTFGFSE